MTRYKKGKKYFDQKNKEKINKLKYTIFKLALFLPYFLFTGCVSRSFGHKSKETAAIQYDKESRILHTLMVLPSRKSIEPSLCLLYRKGKVEEWKGQIILRKQSLLAEVKANSGSYQLSEFDPFAENLESELTEDMTLGILSDARYYPLPIGTSFESQIPKSNDSTSTLESVQYVSTEAFFERVFMLISEKKVDLKNREAAFEKLVQEKRDESVAQAILLKGLGFASGLTLFLSAIAAPGQLQQPLATTGAALFAAVAVADDKYSRKKTDAQLQKWITNFRTEKERLELDKFRKNLFDLIADIKTVDAGKIHELANPFERYLMLTGNISIDELAQIFAEMQRSPAATGEYCIAGEQELYDRHYILKDFFQMEKEINAGPR